MPTVPKKKTPDQLNPAYQAMLVEAVKRRARVLEMDDQGKSRKEIGEALGISKQRVQQLLLAAKRERATGKST